MKVTKYKLLTGMQDLLPETVDKWHRVEAIFREWIALYGYSEIRTPILETYQLFARSVGEGTDIVGKEMYTFTDVSGEQVVLRPEGTASVLRAVVEHNYLYSGPKKLWYYGPMFRRERPQKGRQRQFYQFGVEALGFRGPEIDAEILAMTHALWRKLGIEKHLTLQLNTLGSSTERENFRTALVNYFKNYEKVLDSDSQRRLYINPLRILDSKDPDTQAICASAPCLMDYLETPSIQFYEEVKKILDALGITYEENFHLVRGLDYYNHTVFEWTTTHLGSQATVCAGGRYNGLLALLGGKDEPGVGFALGMERLLLLLEAVGQLPLSHVQSKFYLITTNQEALNVGLKYATMLRNNGYAVEIPFSQQKIGQQFKKAGLSSACYAIVIGEEELANQLITFKDLRSDLGQHTVKASEALTWLKKEKWVE